MPGKPSAAVEAAMRQYQRAPADNKPTDVQLAKKHGLNRSTVYRAIKKLAKEQGNA